MTKACASAWTFDGIQTSGFDTSAPQDDIPTLCDYLPEFHHLNNEADNEAVDRSPIGLGMPLV